MFTCHPHHSSLALNVATLHANLNTLSFSPKLTYGVCWAGWICHSIKDSGMSLITQKLASDLPLESISLLHVREDMYAPYPSHRCANRHELRACTLMWLIILITFCKTLLRWHFPASQHFSTDNTVSRLTFRSDLFDASTLLCQQRSV